VAAVGAEWQGLNSHDGSQIEIAIKMRKQRTAARRFPFQSVAELCAVDADQQQAALTREMLLCGFDDLSCGRKMNEAAAAIDLGAAKYPNALSRPPQWNRAN
jgi:hypothetical protein